MLEQRIGELLDVLVAVVEGEADEAALEVAGDEAAVHLVERDDIDAGALELAQQPLEELRRHLQQPVGLEGVAARRAHVMHGQDGADAADQRPQQMVQAAEIERFQPAADDRLFHVRVNPNGR